MKKRTIIILSILGAGVLLMIGLIIIGLIVVFATQGDSSGIGNQVAVVEIKGAIYDSSPIIKLLHIARDKPWIKAIVLRVDSPGGTVGAAQEIYSELKKIRNKGKVVVVSMGDVAASGAYYVSCGAQQIVANPGTLTGSIGVLMSFSNWEGLFKKIGLEFQVLKSGEHKDIGSPFRPMTPEEKKLLQGVLDNVYDQFVRAVLESRKEAIKNVLIAQKTLNGKKGEELTVTDAETESFVKKIADGSIYSGEQAFKLGLVDRLGNLQDAIDLAAKLAGIKVKPKVVTLKPRSPSFLNLLLGESSSSFITPLKRNGVSLEYILK